MAADVFQSGTAARVSPWGSQGGDTHLQSSREHSPSSLPLCLQGLSCVKMDFQALAEHPRAVTAHRGQGGWKVSCAESWCERRSCYSCNRNLTITREQAHCSQSNQINCFTAYYYWPVYQGINWMVNRDLCSEIWSPSLPGIVAGKEPGFFGTRVRIQHLPLTNQPHMIFRYVVPRTVQPGHCEIV